MSTAGWALTDLFCLLHHLRIAHSSLPPDDETKTQESMHTAPNDFWGDLVPRWRSLSVRSGVRSIGNQITDASKNAPREYGMKRGAWKSTVDRTL